MFDLKKMAEKALKAKVEEAVRGRVRDLEVIVNGTEVTIRGEVETAADKQAVLADLQNVEGLTKIITGLNVAEEVHKTQAKEKTYTVQAGDTLWGIAQKFLGNGALYTKIYEANKDVIGSNPDIIKVGMVLKIPQ